MMTPSQLHLEIDSGFKRLSCRQRTTIAARMGGEGNAAHNVVFARD
jgi:hypothetical protein